MSKALTPEQVTKKQIELLTDYVNEQLPFKFDGLSAEIMVPVFGDASSVFFHAVKSMNVRDGIIKAFQDSWDISFDSRDGGNTIVIILDVKREE